MKIFLSWSGPKSQLVAEMLREWIPCAIQKADPWMSAKDIEKGARWSSDIAEQLNDAQCGIICLTPENAKAPWVLFEAGALSKSVEKAYVCPYLVGLRSTDPSGPLVQFQVAVANRDDTFELVKTLNRALKGEADESQGEREQPVD